MPWDTRAADTIDAPVGTGATTYTFTDPTPTASAYDATPAMRACQSGGTTCAVTGTYTAVTMDDDSSLLSWITLSGTTLSLEPTDGALRAANPYNVKVTFTPDFGSNAPTYTALVITVTCEITSFTVAGAPSTQTYDIFSPTKTVDLTGITFTQVPTCSYTFTAAYSFATTDSVTYITDGALIVPSIEIFSQDGSDASTQTVTMSTTITVDGGQGQSTLSLSGTGVVPDATFDVDIVNPCIAAAIDDLSFSPATIGVQDGNVGTATFTIPQDAVDKLYSV